MSDSAHTNGHEPDEWPEDDADDKHERPTKDESTIGRIAGKAIASIPKPLLGVRGTMFKRMAMKSLENYHRTAGGDALAINARAGQQIDIEPVLYRSPEECEDEQQPGWTVKGRDKTWNPVKQGNTTNYLGRTPVIALEDDSHVEAGWLAPRIGHAIEMDNLRPLFVNPEINAIVRAGQQAGAGAAVADGGAAMNFELESPGVFDNDCVVDLDSGAGYDGMRISLAKAREWQAEHAASEDMQLQEDRGRLIGQMGEDAPNAFKYLLVAAGLVLGILAIIFILPELMGGGGSSINPLMLAP